MCLCHLPERFTSRIETSLDVCPNGIHANTSWTFQSSGWNKVLLPESFTQNCLKKVCPFGALHDKVSSSFRF